MSCENIFDILFSPFLWVGLIMDYLIKSYQSLNICSFLLRTMSESVKLDFIEKLCEPGNEYLGCLSPHGVRRISTVTCFGAYFLSANIFVSVFSVVIRTLNIQNYPRTTP